MFELVDVTNKKKQCNTGTAFIIATELDTWPIRAEIHIPKASQAPKPPNFIAASNQ